MWSHAVPECAEPAQHLPCGLMCGTSAHSTSSVSAVWSHVQYAVPARAVPAHTIKTRPVLCRYPDGGQGVSASLIPLIRRNSCPDLSRLSSGECCMCSLVCAAASAACAAPISAGSPRASAACTSPVHFFMTCACFYSLLCMLWACSVHAVRRVHRQRNANFGSTWSACVQRLAAIVAFPNTSPI